MHSASVESTTDNRLVNAAWLGLAMLCLARAITAFVPSMWLWGLNVQRFLSPISAWLPWIVAAVTLHPAVGARVEAFLARLGDRLVAGRLVPWPVALAAAALVWGLSDRTWMTGDFLLRQGLAEKGAFGGNLSHSLPLEILLNFTIPRMFATSGPDPNLGSRVLEAIAAGALARIAVALAKAWGLGGSAALTAAGTIFFGGYLTAFTGLGKPAAALCVLTAMAVLGASRLVGSMRSGWLVGASVGLAFVTHRSGAAPAPAWIACLILAYRAHRPLDSRSRMELGIAAGLPIVGAAIALPIIWRIVRDIDLPRHLLPENVRETGILSAAFAPMHLADLANLLLLYTPAVIFALILVVSSRRASVRGADALVLGVLALSFVPLLLFIHPIQGVFRDLEVFAPAGLACALIAACVLGRALQERRLASWLAPALIASVLVPSVQWLMHFHDAPMGLERARAFALEAPARAPDELAQLWDLIAYRAFRQRDWTRAVEASEHSVRFAPHERALTMLAIARTYAGDYRGAELVYLDLVDRVPSDPLAWLGLCGVAFRLGDSLQLERALPKVKASLARPHEARVIRKHLEVFPQVWPSRAQVYSGSPP